MEEINNLNEDILAEMKNKKDKVLDSEKSLWTIYIYDICNESYREHIGCRSKSPK